ncbi:ABC transporter ATP-binding protein [Veillonella sp.]|uniref:ABC transporter ATP-binding protein n=1 Tax=Veillonella sp. TaxID=1926307 RepID=UPI0029019830|nr:ABC transporter ATP-binding protein [Veillonella sp.]MDU1129715.1 ABC transporter ATP-binding protein [Veillonella sp.]MDU2869313.1 ABC transporter ATP-binding protein [Veillonella sp.]
MAENILTVENLNIAYQGVPAVMDVNFTLERGKVLTIVGESGSGKTTVIRALMGLLPVGGEVTEGSMIFNGQDLRNLSKSEWRSLRGKDMAMIFQDSGSALDPIVRIGKQFRELFKSHIEISNEECDRRAIELLESVSLPNGADMLRRYPHELSGGQRQRVGIAMALALDPVLLIGDEPTSALDVTTQSQVVMQMLELSKQHNSAIVMVTHNLGVAAYMSDYIVVMKKGRVVDAGTPQDILENPSNEYTKQLKNAVPTLGGGRYID